MRYFFLFLFLSSALFASNFSGYNIALSLGGATRIINLEQTEDGKIFFPDASSNLRTLTSEESATLCKLTPVGELSLGWGHCYRYFYLGFLGALNFSGGTIEQTTSSAFTIATEEINSLENHLELSFNILEPTLDFKFGYLFCNNLLYGIIGGAYNSLDLKENHLYYFESDIDPIVRLPNSLEKKKQHNLYGLRLGIGLEHLFCNSCSLFMGYTYTYFTEKTFSATKAITTPLSLPNTNGSHNLLTQLQPRTHLFVFGIRFYW